MVSGIGAFGAPHMAAGPDNRKGPKHKKNKDKDRDHGMPPWLQGYAANHAGPGGPGESGKGLPPGLAKLFESDQPPPGLLKKIQGGDDDDEGGEDDDNLGDSALNRIMSGVGSFLGNLGMGGENNVVPAQAPMINAEAPTTTAPRLTPEQQSTLSRADSILAAAANPGTSLNGMTTGDQFINPNATGTVLAPAVLGGGGGIAPMNLGGSDPTRIIDNGVLTSLRSGDTAAFIGALAGNIQQSQNMAATQFFRLTA